MPNPLPDASWTDIAFAIDPSASRVVYLSDPTSEEAHQVFSVPIIGGVIDEVSHAAATNVQEFAIAEDGAESEQTPPPAT